MARFSLLIWPLISTALAQSSFEVVSVKPHDPRNQTYVFPTCETTRFRAIGVPILQLLTWAYELRIDQSFALEPSLPSWARFAPYDVEAKAKGPMTTAQCRSYVKQVFVERFNIRLHWKTVKDSPRYELRVLTKGHKLKPVTSTDIGCGVHISQNGQERPCDRYQWPLGTKRAITMPELAKVLSIFTGDRPVMDLTGLEGEYKLTLSFTTRPDNFDYPPLERALQDQLGLVMRLSKGDVDLLVVDRLDKPSAN